uniref:trypsin n=1 Tax=Tetraodon nigroviridis TaxID=99883 RepID=H3CKM3_TETNG
TTSGHECKFPFRQGGRIHHHCITFLSSRPCNANSPAPGDARASAWFCFSSSPSPDPCKVNPCQNGGVCALVPRTDGFRCSCGKSFTGALCELRRCYETSHLRYFDAGESWGRIHLRNVEQCTCAAGQVSCEKVRYTACRSNPCHNDGTCRLISSTGREVCSCRHGYGGAHCGVDLDSECYNSKGADYRGAAGTTLSGGQCLPWNSDLLYDELHVGTVEASSLRGLGGHAFCRNPDGDAMPWCYTLSDGAISWEYCRLPSCAMAVSSSRRLNPFHAAAVAKMPAPNRRSKQPVCGRRHQKRLAMARGRILGGNSALPGSHPWMAAIYVGQQDFCAGTLVSSCWVVSAAHCFFRSPLLSQIRVVLGQQRFNVTDHNSKTFGVEKYVLPEQFSVFNPTLHDIVLIKLKKQDGRCARRTPFISPICLPDKNTTFPDHFCCTISGWGHMHERGSTRVLAACEEAGVRLVPHHVCRRAEVYGNHVTDGMLCAGLGGCADACQGDSGGPLACARDGVSFLYGVISWGEGCGRSGKPGVYTNVLKYIDWIHSVLKRKSGKAS